MKVKFWGVRGSHPITKDNCLKYGGNTTCLTVEVENQIFIIDAGTGLVEFGDSLNTTKGKYNLFFTHMHIDHLQGLMFFKPLYNPDSQINLYGPVLLGKSFYDSIKELTEGNLFPVGVEHMKGIKNIDIVDDEWEIKFSLKKGELIVQGKYFDSHPRGGIVVYKFSYGKKSFVFASDIESVPHGLVKLIEYAKNCDLLIHDAQYTEDEYIHKKGWGHSTGEMAIENAKLSNAKILCLTHYNSNDTDEFLDKRFIYLKEKFPNLLMAKEGLEIDLNEVVF